MLLALLRLASPPAQVAAHDAPIKSARFVQASNGSAMLVTGGWDKKLKYWDLRTRPFQLACFHSILCHSLCRTERLTSSYEQRTRSGAWICQRGATRWTTGATCSSSEPLKSQTFRVQSMLNERLTL